MLIEIVGPILFTVAFFYVVAKVVGFFWDIYDKMKADHKEANRPKTQQEKNHEEEALYLEVFSQTLQVKPDATEFIQELNTSLDNLQFKAPPRIHDFIKKVFTERMHLFQSPTYGHNFEERKALSLQSRDAIKTAIHDLQKLPIKYYREHASRLQQAYENFQFELSQEFPPSHPSDGMQFEVATEHTRLSNRMIEAVYSLAFNASPQTKEKTLENIDYIRSTGLKDFNKIPPQREFITWTPYEEMLTMFGTNAIVPDEFRFEHTWVLGPPGSGKTQLFQYLIANDLEEMQKGNCSIVVMDSQGDLIEQISTLTYLQNNPNVILIQPDAIALNPFDMKGEQAVDMLTYVFRALGEGAEMTPKQSALYRYTIRLLLEIPEATLNTFVQILQPGGLEPYRKYIPLLSNPAQIFFANQFDDTKQFGQTKQEVSWRLMLLLENPTFEKMFCAPRTKLNLFDELNTAKLILIDTNKQMLGGDRSALFGRFFISLLLYVSEQRAKIKQSNRLPVYCYIDEAHEYLQDDTVANILDQARKMKIGMVLANQRSSQIKNGNTLDALMTTSIKFVHTDNDRDTHLLARPMKTTPEFLAELPKQVFALYARNGTKEATAITVPFLVMEKMPHNSNEALKERMKAKYGADPIPPRPRPETPPQDVKPTPQAKAKLKAKKDDTEASDSL